MPLNIFSWVLENTLCAVQSWEVETISCSERHDKGLGTKKRRDRELSWNWCGAIISKIVSCKSLKAVTVPDLRVSSQLGTPESVPKTKFTLERKAALTWDTSWNLPSPRRNCASKCPWPPLTASDYMFWLGPFQRPSCLPQGDDVDNLADAFWGQFDLLTIAAGKDARRPQIACFSHGFSYFCDLM